MLSINKRQVTTTTTLANVFGMVGHSMSAADHTTNVSEYGISVRTRSGWTPIRACYTTEPLLPGAFQLVDGKTLDCAAKHVVLTVSGWKYASDLTALDDVITVDGPKRVYATWHQTSDEPVLMGDIEVEDSEHSFFSNGILSHNTHALVNFGANAIAAGKNVFHYSLELNERMVGIRYDSNLTDISSTDCFDAKDAIKDWFEQHKDVGRLFIKEFPARSITINTLRAHIEKLSYKGVRPDLILVDYAGIMRSTEKYELPRFELACIIQELRAFAREMNLPVWTALQSNKDGAKSEIVDVTNMAESYGQAAEADFVLGLQRLSTQKATGYGTLFVAKNRFGIDGLQYKIHLDTARSKLRVLTDAEIEEANLVVEVEREHMSENVLSSFKEAIRKKRNEFTKLGPRA